MNAWLLISPGTDATHTPTHPHPDSFFTSRVIEKIFLQLFYTFYMYKFASTELSDLVLAFEMVFPFYFYNIMMSFKPPVEQLFDFCKGG